jgi:predicted Fe-Mo cluster-binding NifX family protein
MRVAIPVWQERISPVFDVARRLLVVDIEDGSLVRREERELGGADRAEAVRAMGVEVLICGAVSRLLEAQLRASGVELISETCGPVEQLLDAFLSGTITDERFRMPGCCRRRRRYRGADGWHDAPGGRQGGCRGRRGPRES